MTHHQTPPSDKLLPCPFCGGAARREDMPAEDNGDPNAGGSCISCTKCFVSTALHFDRKENLVSDWNRRSTPPSVPTDEMVERIAAIIDPRAFVGTPQEIHMYCSPVAVEYVQAHALARAREIVAALAAMPGVPQWQPIETAPKDGTRLLLWSPSEGQFTGAYDVGNGWSAVIGPDTYLDGMGPTHWQPLHTPPTAQEGK